MGPDFNSISTGRGSEFCCQGLHRCQSESCSPSLHIDILTRKLLILVVHCSIQKCYWIHFGWSFGQPLHQIRLNLVSSAKMSFKLLKVHQLLHFVQTEFLYSASTLLNLQMIPFRCWCCSGLPTQIIRPPQMIVRAIRMTVCFDSEKCPSQIIVIVVRPAIQTYFIVALAAAPF